MEGGEEEEEEKEKEEEESCFHQPKFGRNSARLRRHHAPVSCSRRLFYGERCNFAIFQDV
jgi:hypothetical protein